MFAYVFGTPLLVLLQYGGSSGLPSSFIVWAVFILILIIVLRRRRKQEIKAHWYHLFDNLQTSSQEFYQTLEAILQDIKVPDIMLRRTRHSESGILSDRREYLLILRGELSYTICAAPFGTSFYVSWWQGESDSHGRQFLASIPLIGPPLERALYQNTFYEQDTEIMFQDTIHSVVLKMVDTLTESKGVRGLTELERKPIRRTL